MTLIIVSSEAARQMAVTILAEHFSSRFLHHLDALSVELPVKSHEVKDSSGSLETIIDKQLEFIVEEVEKAAATESYDIEPLKRIIDEAALRSAREFDAYRRRRWSH